MTDRQDNAGSDKEKNVKREDYMPMPMRTCEKNANACQKDEEDTKVVREQEWQEGTQRNQVIVSSVAPKR